MNYHYDALIILWFSKIVASDQHGLVMLSEHLHSMQEVLGSNPLNNTMGIHSTMSHMCRAGVFQVYTTI